MGMILEQFKEFNDKVLSQEKWEVPIVKMLTQNEVENMFTKILQEIEKMGEIDGYDFRTYREGIDDCMKIIKKKINDLKEN